jgi:hypothetical protein
MLSRACAQHLGKLLNQIIDPIDFRVDLTKLDQYLLFLDAQFFRAMKKQERRLPWGSQNWFR